MKKNKSNPSSWLLPIKFLILIFMALTCIFAGYIFTIKTVKRMDFFKIRYVVIKGNRSVDFSYLEGRNIFSVDLKKEARYLSQFYPAYKSFRLIRILPDKLFVDYLKRKALACVKLDRYFSVDEGGVLFDADNPQELSGLPVIFGLDKKIFGAKPGKAYNIAELDCSLAAIKEINAQPALKDYKIKTIDARDPREISIFIMHASGVYGNPPFFVTEIKIGREGIKNKVGVLVGLFLKAKNDFKNIKYIDLRFLEPVVKFENTK